jgi:molybdopterin converting factor small subunit
MSDEHKNTIEIRGFLKLNAYIKKNFGDVPLILDLDEPISGIDIANQLNIPREDIEVIFINGFVESVDAMIKPGDRMAFLPPGCPGPYRIALGFYGKNQDNEANFRLDKKS